MGNLPDHRISQSFPFQVTGIDYAGPFSLRDHKGRRAKIIKCYICVFVCFCTKAIHLELTSDLTTESFIACLRRFTSRRGTPCHIYSDNCSTFVGATNELKALGEFLQNNQSDIIDQTSLDNISWHFISPYSPNFGGLWEAAVKSTKFHLKRILLNAILTYEEFSTLITQIEGILNSRPLFALSSDPNDLSPLTPSHFLIGRTITTPPDPDLTHLAPARLSRFEYVQQLTQQFWNRWAKEYVSQLHHQYKWKTVPTELTPGTLVLVKNDNLPSCKWLLGRIQIMHPGKDGIHRVASINTSKGMIKRSTRHLCPLPLQDHL